MLGDGVNNTDLTQLELERKGAWGGEWRFDYTPEYEASVLREEYGGDGGVEAAMGMAEDYMANKLAGNDDGFDFRGEIKDIIAAAY